MKIFFQDLIKILYNDPQLQNLCDTEQLFAGAGGAGAGGLESAGDLNGIGGAALEKTGIKAIRISPDGRHLAVGDRQGSVR